MDTLLMFLEASAFPLLFLVLLGLFAWRYRRAVAHGMSRRRRTSENSNPVPCKPAPGEWPAGRARLRLQPIAPSVALLSSAASAQLAQAQHTGLLVRLAFAAAGITHMALTSGVLWWSSAGSFPADQRGVMALLALAPGLLVLGAFLTRRTRTRIAMALAFILLGYGALVLFGDPLRDLRVVWAFVPLMVIFPLAGLLFLLVRQLRPLLVALMALVVFLISGVALVLLLGVDDIQPLQTGRPWLLCLGLVYPVLGVLILMRLLRRRKKRLPIVLLAVMALAGILTDLLFTPEFPLGPILVGLPVNVLQVYLVWLAFKFFIWLGERRFLPAQVLHFHLCWLFLTLCFGLIAANTGNDLRPAVTTWALISAAFASYAIVLHVALRCQWSARRKEGGKRLLLLRVFSDPAKRSQLLDMLDDTWWRCGRIDLIVGTDLALRTLSARMLESFLLRRTDREFLKSGEQVERRIAALGSGLEGDLHYPVNELYCYADAWPYAVSRLAPESDMVLMDLRGFNRDRLGCTFELSVLLDTVTLRRIVLVTDSTTDMGALEETVEAAWNGLANNSPNAGDESPLLNTLAFTGNKGMDSSVLALAVFSAAWEAEGRG
ncbi:MAG: hypothetical protein IPJ48_16395 [Propionivibrio sp.]|uniref:Uncharacterized protein n=1 Tax=Candidatus Propionivibrio dominans TaxID=2954373 RepID=A0A9D7FMH0_9RHOO|nr:hypothetical protein [Candidatus Propionivibrio dominans]MBL0166208.1 hypothetical protein [Propionivibrio sp.]